MNVYVVTGPREDYKEVSTRLETLFEKKYKWDPKKDTFFSDHDEWHDWAFQNDDLMELDALAMSLSPVSEMDVVIFARDYYNYKFCNAVFFIAKLYNKRTFNEDQLERIDKIR